MRAGSPRFHSARSPQTTWHIKDNSVNILGTGWLISWLNACTHERICKLHGYILLGSVNWHCILEAQSAKSLRISFFYHFFFIFLLFRTAPMAYGRSQARGRIRAAAASLHHSHSNTRSEPRLWPIPQPMATLDPQPTEQGQGSNPNPHRYYLGSLSLSHNGNSLSQHF